jgi:parvulin-like peptidyl-prolyl isomerase
LGREYGVMRRDLGLMIFVVVLASQGTFGTRSSHAQSPKSASKSEEPSKKVDPKDILGSVDDQKITRSDFLQLLAGADYQPGVEKELYGKLMDILVDRALLKRHIEASGVKVTEAEIDDSVARLDAEFKKQGQSVDSFLAQAHLSREELRMNQRLVLEAEKFFRARETDELLRAYYKKNQDLFNQNMIVASHILLRVPAGASAEEKAKVLKRITEIKKEIDTGKMTFAEAANKYSEDEGNQDKVGGYLGKIPRRGRIKSEEFLSKAFALKKGSVSDPVETKLGYHLIKVTEKIDGPVKFNFDEQKDLLRQQYRIEMQTEIVAEERKKAKIEIKPAPPDLFPPATETAPAANRKR